MGMSNRPDPQTLLTNSRVLFTREEVDAAVIKMADEINDYYGDQPLILISVLTGAIIPAA
jgi:hypoxanthine-guanine phosphoribosyltransferase